MKVKQLLKRAVACNDESSAKKLLEEFLEIARKSASVKGMSEQNFDFSTERQGPYISIEIVRELSNHAAIEIRPQIRDRMLSVDVRAVWFADGHGVMSQNVQYDNELDEVPVEESDDVAEVMNRAGQVAIARYAELIERLGFERSLARKLAEENW